MLEKEIQKIICDYLTSQNILWWRVNLGGVKRSGIGMTPNKMKGFPDIAGVLPDNKGKLFAIEIKAKNGRLSSEQIEWIHKLNKAGCYTKVVRSVKDVKEAFQEWSNYDSEYTTVPNCT